MGEGACHQKIRSVLLGARPGKLWVCWKVPEAGEAQAWGTGGGLRLATGGGFLALADTCSQGAVAPGFTKEK